MTILIPSYKPDESMVKTVRSLREASPDDRILVVDDGGGESYAPFFAEAEEAGAVVLHHEVNRGKGAALKTGFSWLLEQCETEGCVTADADGQHLVKDILKVAEAVKANPDALIIGGRKFNRPGVPTRSKFGNYASRFTFNLLYGQCIGDTQTGLRGVPASRLADMAKIPGDRYEYEMNQLMKARSLDLPLKETEIETVYLDEDNSCSHFNPVKDAMRVYKPLLLGGIGLILAAIVDIVLFGTLYHSLGLVTAALLARWVAVILRAIDLIVRRKGRRVPGGKLADFLINAVFYTVLVLFIAVVCEQYLHLSGLWIKWLGDLLVVVYICVERAILIRKVK